MLIVDTHLDLAMNAIEWNRDLTRPIDEIRAREAGMTDKPDRGRGTVCLPEMRRGGVTLCVATQIARYVAPGNPLPGWHSPEQAWAMTQAQVAWYRAMEERGEMVQIANLAALERHVSFAGPELPAAGRQSPVGTSSAWRGPTRSSRLATSSAPTSTDFARWDRRTTARASTRRVRTRPADSG